MRRKPNPDPDPRHKPFVDFAFETYREKFGVAVLIDGHAIGAVAQMLKATRAHPEDYSIEKLKTYWLCSMEKADTFDRKQPVLAWFCSHIDRWVMECNGNGVMARPNTEVARAYIQRRLRKD